jgi:hypothetical protein
MSLYEKVLKLIDTFSNLALVGVLVYILSLFAKCIK